MDDEKSLLRRDTFVLRAIYIVFTSMIVIAFIVIGFVAETWDSIPQENRYFAFVVVNASGAHFFLTLLYVLPSMSLWRARPNKILAVALTVGGITYIYAALILQHWGLTRCLLSERWIRMFPFGQSMISLAEIGGGHFFFYFLPLLAAWTTLAAAAGAQWAAQSGYSLLCPAPVEEEPSVE